MESNFPSFSSSDHCPGFAQRERAAMKRVAPYLGVDVTIRPTKDVNASSLGTTAPGEDASEDGDQNGFNEAKESDCIMKRNACIDL